MPSVQGRLASLILLACLGMMLPLAGGPLRLCVAAGSIVASCEQELVEPCCCGEVGDVGVPPAPCCIEVPELPDGLPVDGALVIPAAAVADLPAAVVCRLAPVEFPAGVCLEGESIRPPPPRECQRRFGVWRL